MTPQRCWPGEGIPGPFGGYREHSSGLVILHEEGPQGSWTTVAGVRISHRSTAWHVIDQVAQAAYLKGVEDGKQRT
jgi:hypothetical protein